MRDLLTQTGRKRGRTDQSQRGTQAAPLQGNGLPHINETLVLSVAEIHI